MSAPFMLLAILSRSLSAVICGAVVLLILFQLRQDARSRAFAALAAIVLATAFSALVLRLYSLTGGPLEGLFAVCVCFTAAIPFQIYRFVTTYFEIRYLAHRLIARAYLAFMVCFSLLALSGALNYEVHMQPNGVLHYGKTPAAYVGIYIGVAGTLFGVYTAWRGVQRKGRAATAYDRQILLGTGVIASGGAALLFPVLSAYTTEHLAYAIGIVLMAGPVLRQRLFDPLTQLNARLQRRNEQLSTILSVGQQATARLHLHDLLEAVAAELHRAFAQYAVAIYLPEDGALWRRADAGADGERFAATCPLDASDYAGRADYLKIPLVVATHTEGAGEKLVGLLVIQHRFEMAFEPDVVEMFHILAHQLATAIHNAELFDQAQQANAYKTRFIHTTSHELRTPLQTLLGTLDFLDDPTSYPGVTLTADYLEDVARVKRGMDHLAALLSGILDLARIEAGQVELHILPVDPVRLLGDLVRQFSGQTRPGVVLEAVYPAQLPPVAADDLRLKQILVNLLSNACKFTLRGHITLDARVDGNRLCFAVSDTGPGIPLAAQGQLFKSFRQGSRAITREYGGSGLGLSISQQFARLHQGEVWFTSQEGQGSTFYCAIPLADADAPCDTAHISRQVSFFPRAVVVPMQVLLVGPDVDRQAYLSDPRATQQPYRVLSIACPEQAIPVALAVLPEVILLALEDGAETLAALRRQAALAGCTIHTAAPDTWPAVLQTLVPPDTKQVQS